MSELVGQTAQDRQVTPLEMGCNSLVTLIGIAMLVVAVVMIVFTAQSEGFILRLAPFYGVLGAISCGGCALTALSIKWIVEGCLKWRKFNQDIRDDN